MKKIVLLFALLGVVSLTANAQCPYSAKASTAKVADADNATEAAAHLAAMDENIEKRVCSTSGNVSYVRKSVCTQSGKVSYANVEYCTKSQKFVNVSPSGGADVQAKTVSGTAKGKSCAKSCAKSCTKSAKANTTTGTTQLVKNEQ
ncbi:MAG: hypothetical protein AAFW73_08575 [Bacteroidota bacterium]